VLTAYIDPYMKDKTVFIKNIICCKSYKVTTVKGNKTPLLAKKKRLKKNVILQCSKCGVKNKIGCTHFQTSFEHKMQQKTEAHCFISPLETVTACMKHKKFVAVGGQVSSFACVVQRGLFLVCRPVKPGVVFYA